MPSIAFAQQSSPCSTEQHRQFVFWLGNWQVYANNKLAGYNRIELAHNGCVLTEHYTTPAGFSGQSLNTYNAATGQWHQTWMDNAGTLLLLNGGLQDGAMVMSGEGVSPSGQPVIHRITWTPNEDGSVRQHWQATAVDKENWQTVFDGLYKKQQ
ncbi:hypothetical protein [Aestuariibacter salexigens]|uniref:hypothetical protein n=1 Tax=Aestuariibacter salexigens TaxID=226010 RepID=UPI0004180E4D|nr:hypothetical protein [Aestuariibacter salexigens]